MGRKAVLALGFLVILSISLSADVASAKIAVGVKEGDWIEYHVTTTGNPPEEHNVTWGRLEVLQVNGSEIRVNSTTLARNGTVSSLIMNLNVEKGVIGAWWIIPVNLNPGESFYDSLLNLNVTIDGEEQLQYAGATRIITNATVPGRIKQWDKSTGMFVLSMDDLPDYTIRVVAYSTNMWAPQIMSIDPTVFYAIVAVATTVVVVVLVFVWRQKTYGASQR
jgi:hypothetical protein